MNRIPGMTLAVLTSITATGAAAQSNYPERPIRIVSPYLAGTPSDVVKLLNAEVNKIVQKPAFVQRFAALGAEPITSTPEQTAAFVKSEQEKWGKVIRDIGLKAE